MLILLSLTTWSFFRSWRFYYLAQLSPLSFTPDSPTILGDFYGVMENRSLTFTAAIIFFFLPVTPAIHLHTHNLDFVVIWNCSISKVTSWSSQLERASHLLFCSMCSLFSLDLQLTDPWMSHQPLPVFILFLIQLKVITLALVRLLLTYKLPFTCHLSYTA